MHSQKGQIPLSDQIHAECVKLAVLIFMKLPGVDVKEPAGQGVGIVDPRRQKDPTGHSAPTPLWGEEEEGVAVSTPYSQ